MPDLSRRDFLKLATRGVLVASGLAGLGMLARFLAHQGEASPKVEFDLGPASALDGPSLFRHYITCFDILMNDPEVDCLYVNLYIGSYMIPEMYGEVFEHMGSNLRKPVVMWSYGPDLKAVNDLNALGERHGIPAYATTGKAIRSLGHLVRYARWRETFS